MSYYKTEIREMNEAELIAVVAEYALKIEDTDYIDADEIIEIIEDRHETLFECAEDDILDSIYNGNWSQAVEMMQDTDTGYMFPSQIADYIEDQRFEIDDSMYEWFDLGSMSALCDTFYSARENARRVA